MGSWAELRVGGYGVLSTKSLADAAALTIFDETERQSALDLDDEGQVTPMPFVYRSTVSVGSSKLRSSLSFPDEYVRSVLGIALRRALKLGFVQRNVVDLVDPPRVARHEITPLSVEEARSLVGKAQEHRFGAVVTVALALGLRKGEALGLRWVDVDLESGSLAVTGTLQRVPKGGLVRDETKNATSRRVIMLPSIAIKTLREHRVRQMQERLAAGARWVDTGYVFTTTLGGPICPRNLLRYFAKILVAAELSPTRFHDLRHSCAPLLFAQGVPAKVVQDVLGHSALRVTMDLYTHLTGSMRG